ncbi:uncharacterized protein LOC133791519 [Humulus lupulus]|uniref:uncharacterized protein LOC133791519 n=1 Tax=Humulus lupulus TaxID=3486 RepID=UPI002B402602|nr:uncharacterized protein LOC133791519 [Humulus lupulus]
MSPLKSLMRFKCVSKSWHALISSLSFTNDHLIHHKNNTVLSSTSLLLSWVSHDLPWHMSLRSLVTISEDDYRRGSNEHIHCVAEALQHPIIQHEENMNFSRTYYCNGIICLAQSSMFNGRTVLTNPTTGEARILPRTCLGPPDFFINSLNCLHGEGFGYDLNRIWIKIDVKLDRCSFSPSEEFHTMPLLVPDYGKWIDAAYKWIEKSLAVWNESVALLVLEWRPCSIEMWVMHDYNGGKSSSWTKHLTIGPFVHFYSPLIFWKRDELLMENIDRKLMSYNLNTQKFTSLPLSEVQVTTS